MYQTQQSYGFEGRRRASRAQLNRLTLAVVFLLGTACVEHGEDGGESDAAIESTGQTLMQNRQDGAKDLGPAAKSMLAAQEDANICDFAVYGTQYTNIRDRVKSLEGNIGSAGGMEIGVSSQVIGDLESVGDVFLRNYALIKGDVTVGGQVSYQYGASVTGTVREHTSPPVYTIPTKTVSTGTADVFLYSGQKRTLAPGSYDEIHAYAGSTLMLTAGVYNARLFIIESSKVTLNLNITQGLIEINVKDELRFGDQMVMTLIGGTDPDEVRFYSNYTSQVRIGTDLTFYGVVEVPYGELYAYSRTKIHGRLYAKRATVDTDSEITGAGCPECLSGACCDNRHFRPAGYQCRAAAGVCDVSETCTGASGDCPTDSFEPLTTKCRLSNGICDVAETCTGASGDCPADSFAPLTTKCRLSKGICDVAETCTGTSSKCPADAVASSDTLCRASKGICDVEEMCDGIAKKCPQDGFAPLTTECRPSAGICDVTETCSGQSVYCPADGFEPLGTSCSNQDACDGVETCDGTGNCSPGQSPVVDDGNPCTVDSCDAVEGVIHFTLPNGTPCGVGMTCQAGVCVA